MDVFFQLTLNSIIAGSLYALVALGFSLLYRVTKFFNFAHGAVSAVGGYVVFYLVSTLGFNVWIAGLVGVLFAGLVGFGLYRLVYLPLLKKKASAMVLLIASLGVFTVLQALLAVLFTSQFRVLSTTSQTYELFGGFVTDVQIIIVVLMVVASVGMFFLLRHTLFGKAVRAIGDTEEVSKIVGINTTKVTGSVFFIGSAVAGLAGVLLGFDVGIEPTMGLDLLLKGVVGSIIGGMGSLGGAVLGSFLLGFVENFGIWKISGEWKDAIAFGLLILFLIFRPRGIMNTTT